MRRTSSASTGSTSSRFLILEPRRSASTIRYPSGGRAPFLRRFAHCAGDVLAIFPGCIFIEDPDDLQHQLLRRIITGRLGGRNHLNAVLAQLADGELHLGAVAIETRESMDADNVEATVRACSFIEHALECGSTIIRRRRSRLDKLVGDYPALGFAKTPRQRPLGRNGYIACRLP